MSSQIKELTVRQQCRDKLPIWFGGRDNYYHGLLEVMMNANDEMTTYCDKDKEKAMYITLDSDRRSISVRDSGRGINLFAEHDGKPVYKLLFETLFAGTNFDNMTSGKETTGTNGCGLTVLNHTSEFFKVTSITENNECNIIEYENGVEKYRCTDKVDSNLTGTKFTFRLDPQVYNEVVYNVQEIKKMCNRLAGVSESTIYFKALSVDENYEKYYYSNLYDYMKNNCASTIGEQYGFDEKTVSEVVKTEDGSVEENNRLQLIWSLGVEPFQETFLNCTYLKEGGTIYDGVLDGFRKIVDKYSDKKVKITTTDIQLGLNFCCAVWTNNVEFANQTKFSTKKSSYKKHVVNYICDNLEVFRLEHKKVFDDMVKHFVDINNHNKKNEESIKQLKNKIQKKKGTLSPKIEGLIDCDMRKSTVDERILIIDEGKSANHTLISARDSRTMGCIGLRGRFINSLKTSTLNVLKNQEALAIMAGLGCGIELTEKEKKQFKGMDNFDKENLRYGKIGLACDMDSFGRAIDLSLLCFFYKFYPTLCQEGAIYLIDSPRFVVYDRKEKPYYAYNETEKQMIVDQLKTDSNFDYVGIIKGLGELNKEEFWTYVLSPEARERSFVQVDWSGYKDEIEELLEVTMGDKIDDRKKYIMENVAMVV